MSVLEVSNISKSFDRTQVLKDISFTLEKGQVVSIIGSSGSGKTTLLRCLNFLERPDNGVIRVNNEVLFDANDPATHKESEIRKKRLHFGLVFQSFNLFPQYTALQNVMLAKELLAKELPDYKTRKKEKVAVPRKEQTSKLKMTYKEQREYEQIDEVIEHLENEIRRLDEEMAKNATHFAKLQELTEEKEAREEELVYQMERWEYLNELSERIARQK